MTHNDLVQNILTIYYTATPQEKADGKNWYKDARNVCKDFALRYNVDLKLVCYVMAALSPNNRWQQNILDTEKVLKLFTAKILQEKATAYKNGDKTALKGIACTYTANLVKAFDILQTGDISKIGNGLKTNNFARNIYKLNDDNVTIDFHAISIALNERHTIDSVDGKFYQKKHYEKFVTAYKLAGKHVGLLGKHIQATTWVAWRNLGK